MKKTKFLIPIIAMAGALVLSSCAYSIKVLDVNGDGSITPSEDSGSGGDPSGGGGTTIKYYTISWYVINPDNVDQYYLLDTTQVREEAYPYRKSSDVPSYIKDDKLYTCTGWVDSAGRAISKAIADTSYYASYRYSSTVTYYNVTWLNYDGSRLDYEEYAEGSTPYYKGEEPTRPSSETYDYEFVGWSPTVAPIYINTTYMAQFKAHRISGDVLTITLDKDNRITSESNYQTGNYSYSVISGVTYEGYRFYDNHAETNAFTTLLDVNMTSIDRSKYAPQPGSVYNTTPIKNIVSIEISYDADSSSGSYKPGIYYGENSHYDNYVEMPCESGQTFLLDDMENANYFKVVAADGTMVIKDITIEYTDEDTPHGSSLLYEDANEGCYRLAPTVCEGPLEAGVSTVDVPSKIVYNETLHEYEITEAKTYTYYTYAYISAHTEYLTQSALTDPIDVANYYLAFGTYPVNYTTEASYNSLKYLFGTNARRYKEFTSPYSGDPSNDYSTAIPNVFNDHYLELDIALNTTYESNRGTGRLVVWLNGIDNPEYGSGTQRVIHYTDDHYASFREYNNACEFLPRFNALRNSTQYVWSQPTNITPVSA